MLKYIKKAYIMSVASYNIDHSQPVTDRLNNVDKKIDPNNLTTFDEHTKQLLEAQKEENSPEKADKIAKIIEKRNKEMQRINTLSDAKKQEIMKVVIEAQQNYAKELAEYNQNIQATLAEVKQFNSKYKERAKEFTNFMQIALNTLKSKGEISQEVKAVTDGNKVFLTDPQGIDEYGFFTIPKKDGRTGKIIHRENLARLDNFNEGFSFLKDKIKGAKSFQELGQEVIAKATKQEKQRQIASIKKGVGEHNKMVIKNIENNIKNLGDLPKGVEVIYNSDNHHVEIRNNNKVLVYYTPNLKDKNGSFMNTEKTNIQRHSPNVFNKWVDNNLKKFNIA